MPVFSNGFEGRDGIYRIAITFPILNENTGEYTGLVAASLPTVHFFEHYGNIYDIKSQYLAVLDRNAIQLIHPVKSFIGTSFYGNHTQQINGLGTAALVNEDDGQKEGSFDRVIGLVYCGNDNINNKKSLNELLLERRICSYLSRLLRH